MNREWVKEETTLGLITELIDSKQKYVEISKSGWLLSPWKRFRKGHKLKELAQKNQVIADELSARYEIILWQMSLRVKASGRLTDAEWENCQTSIWQLVKDHARTMTNYRRFCGVLWDACRDELGNYGKVASLVALRPKFMLRQFVDEMPNSDARGLLRACAFGRHNTKLSGKELIDSLTLAFGVLHLQVLSRIDDLSALSDGEITPEMARAIKEPFLEYRQWLFES